MKKNRFKWIFPIGLVLLILGLVLYVKSETSTPVTNKITENPCGVTFPKTSGYVNDFYHLFTEAERFQLDSIIAQYEKETTNQIAIITIDSAMLGKCDIDEYTLNIANDWGIGIKGKNNGIAVGIAPGLKKIRIQNGNGIRNLLTDAETADIINNIIIPHFKNAQYFEGMKNGLYAIFKELNTNISVAF